MDAFDNKDNYMYSILTVFQLFARLLIMGDYII